MSAGAWTAHNINSFRDDGGDAGEHRRGPGHSGGEEGGNVSCRGGQEGQQQQGEHYTGDLLAKIQVLEH